MSKAEGNHQRWYTRVNQAEHHSRDTMTQAPSTKSTTAPTQAHVDVAQLVLQQVLVAQHVLQTAQQATPEGVRSPHTQANTAHPHAQPVELPCPLPCSQILAFPCTSQVTHPTHLQGGLLGHVPAKGASKPAGGVGSAGAACSLAQDTGVARPRSAGTGGSLARGRTQPGQRRDAARPSRGSTPGGAGETGGSKPGAYNLSNPPR